MGEVPGVEGPECQRDEAPFLREAKKLDFECQENVAYLLVTLSSMLSVNNARHGYWCPVFLGSGIDYGSGRKLRIRDEIAMSIL